MLDFDDESPCSPTQQLARLRTCQTLIPAGIPFVVWGLDIMGILYRVPVCSPAQFLICADGDVTAAVSVLTASNYKSIELSSLGHLNDYAIYNRATPCFFQKEPCTLLKHVDCHAAYEAGEPEHILVIGASIVHFDMNDPTRTCKNTSPPSYGTSQILFPTLRAFLDSIIDTVSEPPLPCRHLLWTFELNIALENFKLYIISREGGCFNKVNPSCEEMPLIDSCWDVLEGVKEENRLYLAQSFDPPRGYHLGREASAYERFLVKKDRMRRAGLPVPTLNIPYCPWRRSKGQISPFPIPEIESEIRDKVKAQPFVYSAFRKRWPHMMRALSRF